MQLRSILSLLPLAMLAAGACGVAQAESTYGYNSAGGGGVSARARLNISIVVPKVVVLRVGSAGAATDTLTYNARVAIPSGATVTGDTTATTSLANQAVVWNGNAPTTTVPGSAARAAAAFAWTNGGGVAISCSASVFAAGGPALGDIAVANTGGASAFPHPGANLGNCGTDLPLTANTPYADTWTYTLTSTGASSWKAGAYATTVTYTAAGV